MPSALLQSGADLTRTPRVDSPSFLVLGHGSREAAANDQFEDCVQSWRARRQDAARVAHAYVELAKPSLDEGLAELAKDAAEVIVVPLFLFAACHIKNDLPLALRRARTKFPHVRFAAAAPLGVHPELAQLAFERAASVAPMGEADVARTALVVVGRGSSDPDANGDFCKLVRLAAEGRGLMLAEASFTGITRPRLSETLEHVARAQPERIVVVPYLLFPGRLLDKLREDVAQFVHRYPWTRAVLAPPLGRDDRLFALLDERAKQAQSGQAPLPCDTCLYRTELPGFAEQAGGLRAMLWSVRHSLTHSQAVPHVHAHRPVKKHILVCGNGDCVQRGAVRLLDGLRRAVRRAGLQRDVRVTKTSCMGRCGEGPAVVIYPDGVWYRQVQVEDVEDIVEGHIHGDRLVARIVDSVMQ
jgi:sirohydrochlorin cobaltochelatase